LSISLPDVDQFSKFFYLQTQQTICNKMILKALPPLLSGFAATYLSPFLRYGQFSVEKRTLFSTFSSLNPQFEIVRLALDGWNFAFPSLTHMANYSCKKFFPYDLNLSHNTSVTGRQTDRQTDGRTDDNHANSSTVTMSAKNIMHIRLPVQISAKMTVVTFSDIWCTWLSSLAQGQLLSTAVSCAQKPMWPWYLITS